MTLADLNVRVGFLNDLKKGLGGIERDLRRASSNFAKAGNEIAMSLSLPLGAFAVKAVQTSAQMESLKLAMRTTFQDAGRSIAQADKELEALRKSAMAPGLEFEGAVKGSIALQNVGFSAEYSRKIVEQLANTISMSGGDPESMNRVIKQFTQMSAKGKILQEDLGILVENMPALSKLMKDTFGTANAEALRDMGVSAEEFIQKTVTAMEKLPRVSGGLANSITNMGQAVQSFLATIGEDIATTFDLKTKFENFGKWLEGVATWFKGLSASTKEWILYVGAAVIALGPLLKVLAGIGSIASTFISFLGGIIGALKSVAGAALSAAKSFQAMSLAQKATLVGLGIAILVAAATMWSKYADSVDAATQSEQRVQKAISDTQTEIGKEQIQANILFETLKDLSKGTDERAAALDTLKSKYPTYLEGMKLEELSLGKIETAQKLVNEQIVRSVALRMKAVAQEETAAKIAAKLTRITQIKGGAQFTPTEGLGVGVMDIAKHGSAAAGVIAKMQREVDMLNGELVNLDKQFEKTFNTQRTGESVVTSDMLDRYYNPETPSPKSAPSIITGIKSDKQKKGKDEPIKATIQQLRDLAAAEEFAAEASQVLAMDLTAPKDNLVELAKYAQVIVDPLDAMAEQFAIIDNKAAVMGDVFNPITEKINLLKSTMIRLIEEGANPFGLAITSIKEQISGLDNSLELNRQKWIEFGKTVTEQINGGISDALITISEGLGAMMAKTTNVKGVLIAALMPLLDMLQNVGKMAIATGVAVLGIKKALQSLNPVAALAGGAALIALAGFVKTRLSESVPKFANGGTVDSPTMAMFGEYPSAGWNPEHALRTDQLQGLLNKAASQGGGGNMTVTGTLRGNGRELLAVLEQASIDKMRRGG